MLAADLGQGEGGPIMAKVTGEQSEYPVGHVGVQCQAPRSNMGKRTRRLSDLRPAPV